MSWVKATHTDSSPHRPIFVNLSTVKTLQRSATEASTIVKFIDGTTLAVTEAHRGQSMKHHEALNASTLDSLSTRVF